MPHARSTAQLVDPADGTQLAIKPGVAPDTVVDALIKAGKSKSVQDGLAVLGHVRVRRHSTWINFQARVKKWIDASGPAGFTTQKNDATCMQFRSSNAGDALIVSLQWDPTTTVAAADATDATAATTEPAAATATAEPPAEGWCSVM
jgi:hypothetical protein